MHAMMNRLIEPKMQIPEGRRRFSNSDIRKLVVPLFFEQMLVMLVGIADTFMVSYAGDAAVSGVSLVNMFNTIFIYLFTALASGGAVVVSQYIGRRERALADLSGSQLLMFSTLLSVVLTAVSLIWNRPLLSLLFGSVEADVMEACVVSLRISAYSFPALAVYNAGAALCRSMNETKITLYVSAASNVINVVGNAIGIFVLHAGVAGVAYPTLAARTFSAIAITVFCFRGRSAVRYHVRDIFRWEGGMLWRILKVAVPNGVENGLFQLIKVALSSITALFGTVQIAANGIAQSIWSLAALVGAAMGPAFVTVIGQCMGAEDSEAAEYYMQKLMRDAADLRRLERSGLCGHAADHAVLSARRGGDAARRRARPDPQRVQRGVLPVLGRDAERHARSGRCALRDVRLHLFDGRLPARALRRARHLDEPRRDRRRARDVLRLGCAHGVHTAAVQIRKMEAFPRDLTVTKHKNFTGFLCGALSCAAWRNAVQ